MITCDCSICKEMAAKGYAGYPLTLPSPAFTHSRHFYNGPGTPTPKSFPAAKAKAKTGFNCCVCNSRNEYAEANQEDGTYCCYECR